MHLTGCYSEESRKVISWLERRIESLTAELRDTLVIITADHGHVNTKRVYKGLSQYYELSEKNSHY